MNDVILKELKIVVERAVRPVRATVARKRKMREELLAHLVSIFEEEARHGDEQAALEEAKRRFGDPRELTTQLQQAVPRWDRCRSILESMGCEPGESAWHLAARHFLVTLMIYTAILAVTMPMLLAFAIPFGIEAEIFPGGFSFVGVMLAVVLVVVLFNTALSLGVALWLNKFDSTFKDEQGRKLLATLCVFVFPFAICGLFSGAAIISFSMARQATEEWRYKAEVISNQQMPPQMTSTAYRQGAKNALVCGAGVLVMWLLIGGAIWQTTGKPISESFGIAFALLLGFSSVWFLAAWFHGRQAGGQTLLDCGPHRSKKVFLLFAMFSLLMLGLTGLRAVISASNVFGIAGPVLWVSFGVCWLIMAGGRLQVRENGIWQFWCLLRWGKIKSYHWADDRALLVRARGPVSFLFWGALPVPPEYKDAFDQLLQKHCAARSVT